MNINNCPSTHTHSRFSYNLSENDKRYNVSLELKKEQNISVIHFYIEIEDDWVRRHSIKRLNIN